MRFSTNSTIRTASTARALVTAIWLASWRWSGRTNLTVKHVTPSSPSLEAEPRLSAENRRFRGCSHSWEATPWNHLKVFLSLIWFLPFRIFGTSFRSHHSSKSFMDGARPSADVPPNFSTQTPAADAIPETAGDAIVAAPAPSQWQLLHQKLSLAVHLERKKISGYAEVRIRAPASGAATDTHKATDTPLLARFLLDAQCTVHKVTSTDDVELRYACFDPYNVSDIADRLARGFDLPIFAKWHAMCHRERVHQGTLWVEIPNEVGSKGEGMNFLFFLYSVGSRTHCNLQISLYAYTTRSKIRLTACSFCCQKRFAHR